MARSRAITSRTKGPTSTAEATGRCSRRSRTSYRRTNGTERAGGAPASSTAGAPPHPEELEKDAARAGTVHHQIDLIAPLEVARPTRGDRGRSVPGPGHLVLGTWCCHAC